MSIISKYTAICNNTICLLHVINKRVAQLIFKIILRCEKLARYTNLLLLLLLLILLFLQSAFSEIITMHV